MSTPRTDAVLLEINEGRVYENEGPVSRHARQLETELQSAEAKLAVMAAVLKKVSRLHAAWHRGEEVTVKEHDDVRQSVHQLIHSPGYLPERAQKLQEFLVAFGQHERRESGARESWADLLVKWRAYQGDSNG